MTREDLFTPKCIRTVSGLYMNVFEPTPEMICIEDIAHALSHDCRFGGHLKQFYSVAEHSIHCCDLVPREDKLAALMHDATEAYLRDLPRPIKNEIAQYKEIEDKLIIVIADKFDFEYPFNSIIKEVDDQMLKLEWSALMLGEKVDFNFMHFNHRQAKELFLSVFNFLTVKNK